MMRACVVTVSNRAAAGVYADRAGPILVAGLRELGFAADEPLVVPDGEPVVTALREAVAEAYDVVLTTGGTGLNPNDQTPEMTRRVLEVEVPGLAEAVRAYGVDHGVPTAALSRGLAGLAGSTLIVNLPGSSGGARDGMAVLAPVLRHAVEQIRGGDHPGAQGGHDMRGGNDTQGGEGTKDKHGGQDKRDAVSGSQ
ncbi:MogA/MoaB family molybdenum cofactor biosynthesis protein [Actinopolymorpha sp. B17G11]|uniref:MogA/MoaB family molybdenum cofactor biosynthesis protein n=1 Tax=Actinopolymorpha sp. B17G11 TaxID=3160861 RepID=UPI0032E509A9